MAAPQLHRVELASAGALRHGRRIARCLELAEMSDVPAEAVEEVEPVVRHRKQPRFWTLTSEGAGFILEPDVREGCFQNRISADTKKSRPRMSYTPG